MRRSFGEARRWYDRAAATLLPGEERERAIRGRSRVAFELTKAPVDPGVVGSWRLTMPDPTGGTPQEWLLEINDAGDFWFKITRATASRSETGTFKAKDGKWQWTTRSDEQSGTYRVIDSDSIAAHRHSRDGSMESRAFRRPTTYRRVAEADSPSQKTGTLSWTKSCPAYSQSP